MNTSLVPSDRSEPNPSEPVPSEASPFDQTPQGYAGLAEAAQQDLFEFFAAVGERTPALAPGIEPEMDAPAVPRGKCGHDKDPRDSCEQATRSAVEALDEVAQANLRRLESTLSWLQSEAQACRLPRAAQLAPIEGLPVVEAVIDRSTLHRTLQRAAPMPAWVMAQEEVRSFSLPQRGRGVWRGVVKFLSACAVAAPAAYLFAVATTPPHRILADLKPQMSWSAPLSWVAASKAPTEALRVSLVMPEATAEEGGPAPAGPPPLRTPPPAEAAIHSSPDVPRPQAAVEPSVAVPANAALTNPAAPEKATAARAGAEDAAAHDAVSETPSAPPLPAAAPAAAPSSSVSAAADHERSVTTGVGGDLAKPSRSSDGRPARSTAGPREITLWIDQGRQFFDAGDLVAARILFRRAANAGDSAAAVAMGATYDPVILAGRGVRGFVADLDKARSWYERARELGSPEGPRRLEMLANR